MKTNIHTHHGCDVSALQRCFSLQPPQLGRSGAAPEVEVVPEKHFEDVIIVSVQLKGRGRGGYPGFNSAILGHVISFLHQFSLQLTSKVKAFFFGLETE